MLILEFLILPFATRSTLLYFYLFPQQAGFPNLCAPTPPAAAARLRQGPAPPIWDPRRCGACGISVDSCGAYKRSSEVGYSAPMVCDAGPMMQVRCLG